MKAWELLSDPAKWCQGQVAKDNEGNGLPARSNDAVKWCALGAVFKCYPNDNIAWQMRGRIEEITKVPVGSWNDYPDRRHQDVVDLLKRLDI